MSEGVYLIKLDDGTIVYTNPAFDDMFGYNPGEMIGKDVAIVNAPIDKKPEETKDEIMGILKETGEWHGEVLNVKKDGIPFWCYANVSLFDHLEYGTVIVAVHTDITERKKVKGNIRILMEDLKRSNVELEQFAYIASHDLQEPLRTVSGFASLLEKRYKESLDKDAHEFIEFIIDGATRMQDLINDLLTFSRIGTKGTIFKPTDMNVVLEAILNNVRISAIETNAIITNDPLPVIIADESQIVQLLQNVISNAIKFHGLVPPKIHISGETKKNEWIFTVRDNGIGIDSKNFERIFVIFQRLFKKGEFPGTGIGLAVCKKIVQHHRGKIWVESELKKGSTFYFSIPRNQNGGSKNKKVLYSN
jgi:PAS domain S-box-containing protein